MISKSKKGEIEMRMRSSPAEDKERASSMRIITNSCMKTREPVRQAWIPRLK